MIDHLCLMSDLVSVSGVEELATRLVSFSIHVTTGSFYQLLAFDSLVSEGNAGVVGIIRRGRQSIAFMVVYDALV